MSAAAVRRRILFWVEAGVVVDHAPGGEPSGEVGARGAEGAGGAAAPATRYARATRLDPALHGARLTDVATWDEAASVGDEGREAAGSGGGLEHMAPFEPYVHSVLHNMGPMPLDRLHAMLKRFVISPKCVVRGGEGPGLLDAGHRPCALLWDGGCALFGTAALATQHVPDHCHVVLLRRAGPTRAQV